MNNSKKGTLFRIDLKNSNEFIVARRTSLKLGTVFKKSFEDGYVVCDNLIV